MGYLLDREVRKPSQACIASFINRVVFGRITEST